MYLQKLDCGADTGVIKMFNSYSVQNPQTVKINAVSGTIVKNYRDSIILRFHMKSRTADGLFNINPHISDYGRKIPVIVLQVMLCGEQELLAEVMRKSDFNKMFDMEGNHGEQNKD